MALEVPEATMESGGDAPDRDDCWRAVSPIAIRVAPFCQGGLRPAASDAQWRGAGRRRRSAMQTRPGIRVAEEEAGVGRERRSRLATCHGMRVSI